MKADDKPVQAISKEKQMIRILLAQALYSEEAESRLKNLIMQYLNSERMVAKGVRNISELVDMVYYDMAGMGILFEYLKDGDVEEINVNGYNGVKCNCPMAPENTLRYSRRQEPTFLQNHLSCRKNDVSCSGRSCREISDRLNVEK